MKLTAVLPVSAGLAMGYVLGAAAGRDRYQQIVDAARSVIGHPRVRQVVFDAAGQATENANRIPGPAADLVDAAATRLQDKLTEPDG